MRENVDLVLLVAVLTLLLTSGSLSACTWASFFRNRAAIVARTFDWTHEDDTIVKGHGRDARAKTADTPNALEYAAKYASIQINSFRDGLIVEAMNEKGLQGSALFLEGSLLSRPRPERADVDPNRFIVYAVDNFATVRELVEHLDKINVIPAPLDIPGQGGLMIKYPPEQWPGHFAFADTTGDKAIIEFVAREVKVYHGPMHEVLTNEPFYDIHLAFDCLGYHPNGSISSVDRRTRAKDYLRNMRDRDVAATGRALLAMRGLLASVLAGTEEADPGDGEVYPTLWTVLADQNAGRYYLTRQDSWCTEIYDFSMFAPDRPEAVRLKAAKSPYGKIEDE